MSKLASMIDIQNVSFSYSSGRKALDRINLVVSQNQIFGLLGPNGGGKTTLFKIISSLIRNYEGAVFIDGLDQKKDLKKVLSRIGVVFQFPSLDKKLTVQENLMYQSALYGLRSTEAKQRIQSLLTTFSIQDRRNDRVEHLSGGLARRVEIVKSLLHSPKILIMDEPSTGLDMGARIDLWNFLSQIRKTQNVTIMLTTHFAEEADRCDQIALLDQGKVVCSGLPNELKQKLTFKQFHVKPKDIGFTKNLLSDKFQISFDEKDEHLHFKTTSAQQAQSLALELSKHAEELICRDPSLEDVFLFHTGRDMREIQS